MVAVLHTPIPPDINQDAAVKGMSSGIPMECHSLRSVT